MRTTFNPFDVIIDRLEAIENKVGDINMIVRSGNLPPIRREKKPQPDPALTSEKMGKYKKEGGRKNAK